MTQPLPEARFHSRHPLEGDGLPAVFGHFLFRPFVLCLSPVLAVCLIRVLMGQDSLSLALGGVGIAFIASMGWTYWHMNRLVVEIRFQGDRVAMVSAWKAAQRTPALSWERALDVRTKTSGIRATVGHTTYDLPTAEWPDLDTIRERLLATRPSS